MKRFSLRRSPTSLALSMDAGGTDRRAFLGLAAKGALSVVVSQTLLGCVADSATAADLPSATGATPGSASTSCVLTAALTEGPYFVDEKLQRSPAATRMNRRTAPPAEGTSAVSRSPTRMAW
jgi:hypothetical protein